MATRRRPPFVLLINIGRGLSSGPMSISTSSSADINPYPSSSSSVRSMLHTIMCADEQYDEANSDRLLEPAPFLVARLAKNLQLRGPLEVSSMLFIFWGRSRG